MHTQDMLDAHPRDVELGPADLAQLAGTIEALEDCANACTQCADACLGEPDLAPLARCIRLNLDCADVCTAAARVIARQTEPDDTVVRPLLEACIAACQACAAECERHAPRMRHCRICAETCRSCEQSCRDMLDRLR
jgi:hypothetical protein